jgi:hypothetical protein
VTDGRTLARLRHGLRRESGFTLVETLMAAVILLIVATSLAGVLTSAISAHTVSRERTIAEQVANDQVESIRRLPYDSVGVVSGNPPGTVVATRTVNINGLAATVTTQISYVDDPAPSSYATAANYKRVVVTVTRVKDGKLLTRVSTFIAPPARAPYGGINNAIINAQVVDFALNTPLQGATVALANGPSSNRSDVTDVTGTVSFAALTPNPTSGAQAHYDLDVSLAGGYQTLAADVPPNAPAHVQLAPSQTFNTTLRIFKPATINLVTKDAGGAAYTGPVNVTIFSAFTGATTPFTVTGGSQTVTALGSSPVLPGVNYTVVAKTTTGLCSDPAPTYVPDNYPTVLSTTFDLTLTPCPSGTLSVDVTQLSAPAANATVDVTGGPNTMSFSGTTDSAGNVTFANVPSGTTTYSVTATKGGQSASASPNPTITTGATTNAAITLPNPPTGTVAVTVNWGGSPASGASVTLSGGPYSISVSGTTSGSGQVTFVNIPAGSGYSLTATKAGESASSSPTVTAGSTTNATLNLPTGTLVVTVTQSGSPLSGATVDVVGGPNGESRSGTTNGSGQATFSSLPAGATAYTVTASSGAQSASASATITAGSTTSTSIVLPAPPLGDLVATADWAGLPAAGATITLTGGPATVNLSGTADSSGQVTFINLPQGGGYTLTVAKNSGTGTTTGITVGSGTNYASVSLTPTKSLRLLIRRNSVNAPNTDVTISVTGGPNGTVGAAPVYTLSGTTNGSAYIWITLPAVTSSTTYFYTVRTYLTGCPAGIDRKRTVSNLDAVTTKVTQTMNMTSDTCPGTLP